MPLALVKATPPVSSSTTRGHRADGLAAAGGRGWWKTFEQKAEASQMSTFPAGVRGPDVPVEPRASLPPAVPGAALVAPNVTAPAERYHDVVTSRSPRAVVACDDCVGTVRVGTKRDGDRGFI